MNKKKPKKNISCKVLNFPIHKKICSVTIANCKIIYAVRTNKYIKKTG